MSTQNFNYIFNITGNASTVLNNIDNGLKAVQSSASKTSKVLEGFSKAAIIGKHVADVFNGLNNAFSCALEPAVALDSSFKDLSAITGETGGYYKENCLFWENISAGCKLVKLNSEIWVW